ncbi:uncharacterized protein isoform X2 [Musca autumnalis]|uniref:uncharacterized protein isoform X2 n=1 Tax=Musca autumnalis TaxID=221902 RepID=UPI003CF617EC
MYAGLYIHRPGVLMSSRMFREPAPEAPVFPTGDQRTSELEKLMKELLKFTMDVFKKQDNQTGVEAAEHFHKRIQKFGISLDEEKDVHDCFNDGEDRRCRNKLLNFNIAQKFRPDGYGGVAICFKKHIKFNIIPFETNYDVLIAKTTNLRRNFVFVSVYFPPSLPFVEFKEEISKLFGVLEAQEDVVLCGDFNARNQAWGDHLTSRKGKEIEMLAMEAGFNCANNGKETYRRNLDSQGSVPDLSFVKSAVDVKWDVVDGHFGGSHHHPISMELAIGRMKKGNFLHKRKLMKALGELELDPDLDMIEDRMIEEVEAATSEIRADRVPKYWWREDLKKYHRRQLAAVRKARKYPSFINLERAREEVETWKNMVQKAKAESFVSKIEEVNKNANAKEAWRFLNNVRKRDTEVVKSWNNENDMAYLLHLKEQVPETDSQDIVILEDVECVEMVTFEYEHFEKILDGKKKGSAGGIDRITYEMLKAFPGISKRAVLTAMYNAFLDNVIKDS